MLDASQGQRLQEAGDHAAEEGDQTHGDERASQARVRDEGPALRRDHCGGSTMIVPAMVWCAMPQYS